MNWFSRLRAGHHTGNGLAAEIPFDPATQYAVIRASICTGEKTAGFKDRQTGHFTEVMLIRSEDDLAQFKAAYGVDEIKKEY